MQSSKLGLQKWAIAIYMVATNLALQHHMHNLIRPPLLLLRRPQHLCCILSLLRICSHRVAPFFLIASFDTDDLEGSHSRFQLDSGYPLFATALEQNSYKDAKKMLQEFERWLRDINESAEVDPIYWTQKGYG